MRRKKLLLSFKCLLAVLLLLGVTAETAPDIETIQLKFSITDYTIRDEGNGLCSINIDDFQIQGAPGQPLLPYRIYMVAVPPDIDWSTLRLNILDIEEETLSGEYEIEPAPPAVVWIDNQLVEEWGEDGNIINGFDEDIYSRDDFFPSQQVSLLPYSQMRKWKIARIIFYPVRYNPVSKELILIRTLKVGLAFERESWKRGAQDTGMLEDSVMDDFAQKLLFNFEEARGWYQTKRGDPPPSSTADFVIITTNDIRDYCALIDDFVTHKESLGFSVQVVTEDDFGGGTGNTAAENIRTWLENNYLSLGIEYVLLIGNPHPTSGDIPMKMCVPYQSAPTDYYFADLTGNWDLDGDGRYGEYGDLGEGGIDEIAEVYVGRIPHYDSGNYSDLESILQKIMDYENETQNINWRMSVLLPMKPSDGIQKGYGLGEGIKNDYSDPAGFSSYRIYDGTYGLDPPPELTPCNGDNVQNEWENGYGMVTWWTHGNSTSASSVFSASRCQYLDNSKPAYTFQCSCTNAYPESSGNLAYSLLKQGAIATVAATRYSYYTWYYWHLSYLNSGMAYTYTGKIIYDKLPAGPALFQMKTEASHPHPAWWQNHIVFNLYGDPSVSMGFNPDLGVEVENLTGDQVEEISIQYTLFDSDSDLCGIEVEYSYDGGDTYFFSTMGAGGDGTENLASSPDGISHLYVWDSVADLGYNSYTGVKIRITPNDGQAGISDTTTGFTVDNTDTDGDGLSDLWEISYFGNLSQGPGGDYDSDGLTNLEEQQYDTDPTEEDTDGDGYTDGDEVDKGTDPADDEDYPQPPDQPSIISPEDGETGISMNPALVSSSFSDPNSLAGPAGQWRLEGDAGDESGSGYTGTVNGAVYTTGRAGLALSFDGSDDYIQLPAIDLGETFTIEFWIRPQLYNYGDPLSAGERTLTFITYADGHMLYGLGDGSAWSGCVVTDSGSLQDETWHHIVGTSNGSRIELFIDGSSAGSTSCSGSLSSAIKIGTRSTSRFFFQGLVDEVSFYTRVLDDDEIAENYQLGLAGEHNPTTIGDTHASSDWEIYEDASLTNLVWSDYGDNSNLTSVTVDGSSGNFSGTLSGWSNLAMGQDYWVRMRHTDNYGGTGVWSDASLFTTGITDTDGDGINDDVDTDDDNDGLSDMVETGTGTYVDESNTGTDPLIADTDEDGVNDGDEVSSGTDPNDPDEYPNSAPDAPSIISPEDGETGISMNPALVSSSFSDPNSLAGPAGQWRLEGDAGDESGSGYTGTVNGAVYTTGRAGLALSFDGSDDYIQLPAIDLGETFTIEFWIRPQLYNYGDPLSAGERTLTFITYADGHMLYGLGDGSAWSGCVVTDSGSLQDETWHHIVGTSNGSRIELFIDGSSAGSTSCSGSLSSAIKIGTRSTSRFFFQGLVDEVSFYTRVLDDDEIAENYQLGLAGEHNPTTIGDTHASSDWEIYEDASLTNLVWSDYGDNSNLTSVTVDGSSGNFSGTLSGWSNLAMGQDYWVRMRHTDNYGGTGVWSDASLFTTGITDTDGDGINDDVDTDDDNDGLSDMVETGTGTYVDESNTGTDPLIADTDEDGVNDGDEVSSGTDPNDPDEYPNSAPDAPSIISPEDGETGISMNPALVSSSFSDPNSLAGSAGQWRLEGDAGDESGSGYTGTVNGAVYTTGRAGLALSFDGSDDYIQLPAIDLGETFTIEFWIRPQLYNYGDPLSAGERTLTFITYADGHMLYGLGDGSAWSGCVVTDSGSLQDETWHHIVGTSNGSRIELFIDGSSAGSTSCSGSLSSAIKIGTRSTSRFFFQGLVDEVSFYTRVLDDDEIAENYQLGLAGEHNPTTIGDTHASSDWEIYEDASLTNLVWSDYGDNSNLTSVTVDGSSGNFSGTLSGWSNLAMGQDYWVRMRHTDNYGGTGVWSDASLFTTGITDTDGDGINDDVDTDDDNDGLSDMVETGTGTYVDESNTGTDPLIADTDEDGVNDGDEVSSGTDPNDPDEYPNSAPDAPSIISPEDGETGISMNPALVSSSFSDPNSLAGPAGQWRLEGDAGDESGSGYTGTVNGAVYTTGRAGLALSFDGSDDYIQLPAIDLGETFTIEFWIRPQLYNYGDPLSAGERTLTFITYADGHMLYGLGDGSAWSGCVVTDSGSLQDETWHHIVGTSNGSRIELFIDGSSAGSTSCSGSLSSAIKIGTRSTSRFFFQGLVDEVSFYTRVLDDDEIAENYQLGLAGEHNPTTIGDTHASSDWEIYEDASLTNLVWSDYGDNSNLTSVTVDGSSGNFSGSLAGWSNLAMGTDYWVRVRHSDNQGGTGSWSTANQFTTLSTEAWPYGSGIDIGSNLATGYEPSGVVWHSRLGDLFLVGDDGELTRLETSGSIISTWMPGGDLEGVTIANADTDYIYIGREHPDAILEFDISTGALTGRTWDLTTWMSGADNQGLEALTFVPNGDHPYSDSSSGGLFYAGLQADGKIYVFDLDLSGSSVSHIDTITPVTGRTDLSGLNYDTETQLLYAVYDSSDRFVEMTADGTVIRDYNLPGTAQEGVTLSSSGSIFIADDSTAELIRYDP